MTFAEWLDYYCVNRARLANLLDTTRQAVASWANGRGLPEQYRDVVTYVWGADNVPEDVFSEATRDRSGKMIQRGDDLVWLD